MILFKDIKQNYPVYILDTQEVDIIQGKATQASFPRLEMNQKTGKTEMVVDVTIEANGKIATYTIPENHSVTYAGHLVLATEKPGLANDPDGYDGMIFCRWTADAIGKAIKLDWEKFV